MATLLHIDSSVFPQGASSSRAVTEAFRAAWQQEHPEGTVVYRDLNSEPVPHLTTESATAGFAAPDTHTPEQAAAFAGRLRLIEELEQADAVLIGAPMYNFAIPSTLKAWLDNVILMGRTAGAEDTSIKGKPVTVVASRGGAYGPGTPREGFEYVQNYLRAVLVDALGLDAEFIVPELTMAPQNPAMADLVPLYEASRASALEDAATLGRRTAERTATAASAA
ncbi:FMN-dependent NADH-azoreductase [Streptomyces sp. NPDC090306]|uniref:FMN-dependent NADH-azoreductase n=1 Tax=Streptomyces sp. NPDC090306 TaxID=3365961 RepID=UPI00381FF67E